MARPIRTKNQIAGERAQIAKLILEGKKRADICAAMRRPWTTVRFDIEKIKEQWRDETVESYEDAVAKHSLRYEHIIQESFEMLRRTAGPKAVTTKKTVKVPRGDAVKSGRSRKIETLNVVTEDMAGDPRCLSVALDALRELAKLRGLNAPTKLDMAASDGKPLPIQVVGMDAALKKIYGDDPDKPAA